MTDDYDPTLVTWLRAQLDEDEQVAQAAIGEGLIDEPDDGVWAASECVVDGRGIMIYDEGGHSSDQALHIAHWDPARVLAEVAAKRTLIDEMIAYMEGDYAPWNQGYLQLMALPYADRPGFRDEWRFADDEG